MPKVSVIVRFKNHASTLPMVLTALSHQTMDHEVIAVDSGSRDGCRAFAEQAGARVVTVQPSEFSYGRAINEGAEVARGDTLVILSAHAVPQTTDAIGRLITPLADVSLAGTYGRQIPFYGMNPFEARMIREYYGDTPRFQRDDPRFSNAWSAIRMDVWAKHRFNEVVPGAEDKHWANVVQRHGLAVAYVPGARVTYYQQFGVRGSYDRGVRLGFSDQALRRGSPPRLWQSLTSAAQMFLQDLQAWRTGHMSFGWLVRSPGFRMRLSLGLRRGAQVAARVLEWR